MKKVNFYISEVIMKIILSFAIFFTFSTLAQVDLSEKEKIEQQREVNRKEDALRNEAMKPNEKYKNQPTIQANIDSTSTFDVDHSAFSYIVQSEKDNLITGIKFSGAFSAGFLKEQQKDKYFRLLAGVELPIDLEMPIKNLVPFAGGGFQFGSGLSLYGNIGLDYRIQKWLKVQFGVNFDTSHSLASILGLGLTW